MDNMNVTNKYLQYRSQLLNYSYIDMNLQLESNEQVYIAAFDIPLESNVLYGQTQTLALVFGLNTHLYFGTGDVITGLEKKGRVLEAMQSLLISSHQCLEKMQIVNTHEYYESKNIRAYLKTKNSIYMKELNGDCKEDRFLQMLLNNVQNEIAKCI